MITEKNLLEAGFVKSSSMIHFYIGFPYRKELVPIEEIEDNDLEDEDVPCLLFGNSGINKGFCIYTGAHFVFFNASNPKEAVEWAEKIIAFEPI